MSDRSVYVEGANGRMYQVIDVDDYPLNDARRPCKCVVNHEAQTVKIVTSAQGCERPRLLAKALGLDIEKIAWRLTGGLVRVAADVS